MDIENMNIEKATERCNQLIKPEHANWIGISNQVAIIRVLNELEKKEAIINEMSNFINLMSDELVAETGDNNLEFCKMQKCIENGELDCEECIKECFTKKAEKEGK